MKAKRFFAALLCLCMAVSLLPAGVSASAAETKYKVYEDGTLEYGFFTGGSYGWNYPTVEEDYQNAKGTGADVVVVDNVQVSGWDDDAGIVGDVKSEALQFFSNGAIGGWWAAAVQVPTAGIYDLLVGYAQATNACDYEFYLVPITDTEYAAANVKGADRSAIKAKINAAIANGEVLGNDMKNPVPSSKWVLYDRMDKSVDLNAGYYMFVARCIGGTPTTGRYYYPLRGIVLDPINLANSNKYTFNFRVPQDTPVIPGGGGWISLGDGSFTNSTLSAINKTNICLDTRSGSAGNITALAINVPKSGLYKTSIATVADTKKGIANYYLVPASKASDAATMATAISTDEYYIGTVDSYSSVTNGVPNFVKELDTINVSAGRYFLVVEITGKNAANTYTYPIIHLNSFALTETDKLPEGRYEIEDDGTIVYGFYPDGSYGWASPDTDNPRNDIYDATKSDVWANATGKGDDIVVLNNCSVSGFDFDGGKIVIKDVEQPAAAPYGSMNIFASAPGGWFGIKVDVPAAGTYEMFVGQKFTLDSGDYDYYLVPIGKRDTKETVKANLAAMIADSSIAAYKYGSVVGTGSDVVSGGFTLPYVLYSGMDKRAELKKGSYMLVGICTGGAHTANNRYNMHMRGLVLRPFDTEDPTYTFAQPANTPVIAGKPGLVTLPGSKMSDALQFAAVNYNGVSAYDKDGSAWDQWLALPVNVAKSGAYKTEIVYNMDYAMGITDYYLVPKNKDIATAIADKTYFLGRIDAYLAPRFDKDSGEIGVATELKSLEIAAGDYYLVAKTAGKNDAVSTALSEFELNAFKLTAIDSVPESAVIPASDIFGDTYAYVKDGTVYFIGGLKTIDGTEVGFEVAVNGETFDVTTDKVYENFVVGNRMVKASDWASEYVFITATDALSAGDVATIKPFIVKDGAKVYHGSIELQLNI